MEIQRIANPDIEQLSLRHLRFAISHFCDGSAGKIHTSFGYICQGQTHIETAREVLDLGTGSFFYLPAGTRYRSHWSGSPGIEYYMIHLSLSDQRTSHYRPARINALSIPETADRIRFMEQGFDSKDPAMQMRAISVFYTLFSDALPHLKPSGEENSSALLSDAVEYIRAHFSENYTVDDLAAACHVSESHLHHIFRREWNISPMDYRNEIRLNLAANMMRRGDVSTEELLAATGYSSAIYFRELFKRYYGMTPTQYCRAFRDKH